MKTAVRKYGLLILVMIMITGVCFLFAERKTGMFVDEIYTYGLSNGYYTPFVKSIPGGNMVDSVITGEEIHDYLTVGENDAFAFGSVYYNQTQDVHPPLYYWLFNIASSLTPGIFSKWTGMVLNYIIYMLTMLVLYKLCRKLFGKVWIAAACVAVYGLSTVGMSTMIMIRMYVLLTLLTVLLAYLIACLLEKPRGFLYPLTGLVILAGLFTQYYFVFYAFFVCAAADLYFLIQKRFKDFWLFSASAVIGVILLPVLYPACLNQLFADALVSGGNAVQNLTTFSQYGERLRIFIGAMRHGLKAAILLALAFCAAALATLRGSLPAFRDHSLNFRSFLLIVPAVLTFVTVAIISPVSELRYVYNIAPLFVIFLGFPLAMLDCAIEKLPHKELLTDLIVVISACGALWMIRTVPPDYLYPEQAEYNEAVRSYVHSPCVYFTDNYNGPVTQDLIQLGAFDDFMVTNDPKSEALSEYIENHSDSDTLIVYVDISAAWGSGYNAEDICSKLLACTDYTNAERLYQYGLSDTYVLS